MRMTPITVAVAMTAATAALAACTGPRATSPASAPHLVQTGVGWTSAGIEGPVPAPGSCHYRQASGYVLPDPACTPGAVDTAVTPSTLASTVCRRGGYTASVRPPLELTAPIKRAVLAAYGIPASDANNYELDHLVELAAGGSSDVRNLWPEPNNDAARYQRNQYVHNDKDELEAKVRTAVCGGSISLAQAQAGFASDWTSLLADPGSGATAVLRSFP